MRSAIVGALPITAKMLADDCNIQLHFGSTTFKAGVDDEGNKHLFIPNLPMDDAQAEDIGLGGIVHEDAHFNFTDFDEISLSQADSEVGEWTNVLEDIRAERLECAKYVGAAAILQRMTSAMIRENLYSPITLSMGCVALQGYALYKLRVAFLGHVALAPMADDGEKTLREVIPADAFEKLNGLIMQVDDCASTQDVRLLSERIVAMLRQAAKDQPEDSDATEEPDDEADSEESDPDTSQDSNGEGPDNGQNDQPSGESPQGDEPKDQASENDGSDSAADNPEVQDPSDGSEASSSSMERVGDQGDSDAGTESVQTDSDKSNADPDETGSEGGAGCEPTQEEGASEGSAAKAEAGDDQRASESQDQKLDRPGDTGNKSSSGASESGAENGAPSGALAEGLSAQPVELDEQGQGEKRGTLRALLASQGEGESTFDVGSLLEAYMDSASQDAESVRFPNVYKADREVGNVEDILDRIRGETAAIRRMTQGLLEATARTRYCLGKTGKNVDPTQLWKLRCGDTRVFERRIEGKKQDTALLILLDNSISMSTQIGTVMDAGLAIALAMESIPGISTCVSAFPYRTGESRDDVLLLSDFGESLRHTAERFPAVVVQGTTPMAEALLWSGYHILQTRQQRKIICVVTDGQPDNRAGAEEVIEALETSGVELMALGIRTVVDQLFETSEVINNVQEVGPALFHMLQEKLAKAA